MKILITHYIINIKSYTKTCHLFLMDWQLIYSPDAYVRDPNAVNDLQGR